MELWGSNRVCGQASWASARVSDVLPAWCTATWIDEANLVGTRKHSELCLTSHWHVRAGHAWLTQASQSPILDLQHHGRVAVYVMKIELDLQYLLRYGYGGFLALLYSAILASEVVEKYVAALGGVMATFAVLCIGACIYVALRQPGRLSNLACLGESVARCGEVLHPMDCGERECTQASALVHPHGTKQQQVAASSKKEA
jgi:hypothetical protein